MSECDGFCEYCDYARIPEDLDRYTYATGGWDYECSLSAKRLDDANANESAASTR